MKRKIIILLISYLFTLIFANAVSAISSNVPMESDLYEKLGKLYAFGLVDNRIEGMRPISREDFARQIKEALEKRKERKDLSNTLIDEILEELKKEFSRELNDNKDPIVRIFDEAQTEFIYLKQNPTPHIETNALNTPLVSNRSGESLNDGFNWVSRINGFIDFPSFASFYIEPRLEVRQRGDHYRLDMYRGYLKFGHKKWELELGRDSQAWGNAHSGKIELSNNAQGLTMAKISNHIPATLPWIFRYLGKLKFSFFFSVLESVRDHPNPTFWGTSLMFRPSKYIEWGFSRTTMLGGEGTDGLSFGEYFFEALTGIRIYDSSVVNAGNGTIGFYFLFTLPFLRNTKIYFDGYWEDFGTGNLITHGSLFTRDLAFITGIDIPRMNYSGTLSLKTEFVKTTQITYRSGIYDDGYTYNGKIIGHPIGPDAWGNYTVLGFMPNLNTGINLHINYEKHGRLARSQHGGPLPSNLFEKPEERVSFILSTKNKLTKKLELKACLGYERIMNYLFTDGSRKNNVIFSLGTKYNF